MQIKSIDFVVFILLVTIHYKLRVFVYLLIGSTSWHL